MKQNVPTIANYRHIHQAGYCAHRSFIPELHLRKADRHYDTYHVLRYCMVGGYAVRLSGSYGSKHADQYTLSLCCLGIVLTAGAPI